MRQRSALVLVLGILMGSAFAPSAFARDQGSIGTLGPKNQHLELKGTPLAGVYQETPVQAYGEFRPPLCRAATHCDAVEFEVHYPKSYLREVFFGATITLTWDNPYDAKKNQTGNDLDLFLWGDEDASGGAPASKCAAPDDAPCENIMPEVITVTEPPDTTAEDAEPRAIFLTIVNHHGVNSGYKLTVDWFTFDLPPPPAFKPPERHRSFNDTVQGPYDFEVTEATKGTQTPAPTPRTILVPGPDGKLHEVELPIYAAGQRLGMSAQRNSAVPWITASIVGALALTGLIFYLIRRNRRAMDQL